MNLTTSKRNSSAYTLIELLIVVGFIGILVTMTVVISVSGNFGKARDSIRKQDLSKMQKFMEDYYNDHGKYPDPDPDPDMPSGKMNGINWGDTFTPYTPVLPKDPGGTMQYYYQSDPSSPQFYVIYARLENGQDPDIVRIGCANGCGPGLVYNYAIHSPNVVIEAGLPVGSGIVSVAGLPLYGMPPGVYPTSTPVPTSTPIPTSTLTPSPTINLTPPPNRNDICQHNQCCGNYKCGIAPYIKQCTIEHVICVYDPLDTYYPDQPKKDPDGWKCADDWIKCP